MPSSTGCLCPVTKTLTVNFTGITPAPAGGYTVKWNTPNSSWTFVTPNPTTSPVTIPNVPVCEDVTVIMEAQCPNSSSTIQQSTVVTAQTNYGCTSTITGSHTHSGTYTYPAYIINVTAATGSINLNWSTSGDSGLPNKFTLYDSSNNLVSTTDWKGVAAFAGPWGSSLSTATTGTLTFTPTSGSCYYKLVVESYTNSSVQDTFQVAVACPTPSSTVVPVITALSCTGGNGSYRIDAPAGTTLKVKLTASGTLTNNSTGGYCAQLQGSLVSSTGSSDSENSALINTTGSASIGGSNSLFVSVTVPSTGSVTINTTLFTVNSLASSTSGTLTIFEVNGSAANITQSVCVQSSTGAVSCSSTPIFDWYYADMYICTSCGSGPVTTDFLVALPAGTTVFYDNFYVPAPGSGYEGNVFKITAAAPSTSGYALIMSLNQANNCATACSIAPV
jgi:hypothetical protein